MGILLWAPAGPDGSAAGTARSGGAAPQLGFTRGVAARAASVLGR